MSTITLVTTTRERPECFALLERWIARQTRKPDQWLVINDSSTPERYSYNQGQQVITRTPDTASSLPSICQNWRAAIPHITGDYIVCAEDDDYYSPNYIETMAEGLDQGDLAGLTRSIYYQLLQRRWLPVGNTRNAPLAATGFRRSLLPFLSEVITTYRTVWIDSHLYGNPPGAVMLCPQPHNGAYLHIGMKGMPGAAGLGAGHAEGACQFVGWLQDDAQLSKLVELVGADAAEVYRHVVGSLI